MTTSCADGFFQNGTRAHTGKQPTGPPQEKTEKKRRKALWIIAVFRKSGSIAPAVSSLTTLMEQHTMIDNSAQAALARQTR